LLLFSTLYKRSSPFVSSQQDENSSNPINNSQCKGDSEKFFLWMADLFKDHHARLNSVHLMILGSPVGIESLLEDLSALTKLKSLTICVHIAPALMAKFDLMRFVPRWVEEFSLESCSSNPVHLGALDFPNLKKMDLQGCSLDTNWYSCFSSLTQLKELSLVGCQMKKKIPLKELLSHEILQKINKFSLQIDARWCSDANLSEEDSKLLSFNFSSLELSAWGAFSLKEVAKFMVSPRQSPNLERFSYFAVDLEEETFGTKGDFVLERELQLSINSRTQGVVQLFKTVEYAFPTFFGE
jgi:hypothetical protein